MTKFGLIILFSCILAGCSNNSLNTKFPSDDRDAAMDVAMKFCKAMESLDKNSVRPFLTDSTVWVDTDGVIRPYMRGKGEMAEFEKASNTIWTHEILCSNNNVVTIVAKETGDFYRYLDLIAKLQVIDLHIYQGKVAKIVLRVSTTYKNSQNVEYLKFKRWLYSQKNISEPALMKPDTTLHFNGQSAPRMIYWLKKWRHYSDSVAALRI